MSIISNFLNQANISLNVKSYVDNKLYTVRPSEDKFEIYQNGTLIKIKTMSHDLFIEEFKDWDK